MHEKTVFVWILKIDVCLFLHQACKSL